MDIIAIEDAIQDLEQGVTTADTVQELANLYIVYEHISNGLPKEIGGLPKEFNDVLPAYTEYCNQKRRYQLNEVTDDAVVMAMKQLCLEIKDLFTTLYCNTDFHKERLQIFSVISELYQEYIIEEK